MSTRSAAPGVDAVFASPTGAWCRVDPRLAGLRRGVAGAVLAPLALAAAVAAVVAQVWWLLLVPAALVGLLALSWRLIGRQVRAYGYLERSDDLLVTSGVLVRRLSVVPYGRMQFVDVTGGPLERRLGLATVELHTASPATQARIPGLPGAEAARLRDRLAALGEARAAGL